MPEEGLPVSDGQSSDASASDPWSDASDAFDSADVSDIKEGSWNNVVEPEEPAPKTEEQPKEDKATTPEKVNFWSHEGLDTPELVEKRLKDIQAMFTKKNQDTSKNLEQLEYSNKELGSIIKEVLSNPTEAKLKEVISRYGKDLEASGLSVNWDAMKPKEKEQNTEELDQQKFLGSVEKYLSQSESDTDFAKRVGEVNLHMYNTVRTQLTKLSEWTKQYVEEATKKAVEPLAQRNTKSDRVNLWVSAADELSADKSMGEFSDFVKSTDGTSKFKEFLGTEDGQPYNSMVYAINKNPEAAAKMGWTPGRVLRMAYAAYNFPNVIKSERLKAEEEFKKKIQGAPEVPGSHTPTTKQGGMGWDEIEKEMGDPFALL